MKAYLFEPHIAGLRCNLCRHHCIIPSGKRGKCQVRLNHAGELQSLVYGQLIASHIDPIEKKPLFHVKPGSLSYSIATVGCNFKCCFCQNANIAQMPSDHNGMIMGTSTQPEEIVNQALAGKCKSIAYTYTEPTVYFETCFETAQLAHHHGLLNLFVSNGYMSATALEMIRPFLDGINVDLKAFNDDFYRKYCGARLQGVKDSLKLMQKLAIFIEVTTLLIPGLNDNPEEIKAMADFIVHELGPQTPWHLSRFHPTYKLTDRGPTTVQSLTAARKIGLAAGLQYVYIGNVPGEGGNSFCPQCGKLLIERQSFYVIQNQIKDGNCPGCQTKIHGLYE